MRMLRLIVIGALLATGQARAEDAPPKPMPVLSASDTQVALARAEALGRALFVHDLAAERATDALMAHKSSLRDDKRVRGWITESHDDTVIVSIIDATPAVLYRVTVDADGAILGTPEVLAEPAALSTFEAGAAQARRAAMNSEIATCAPNYNSVVLPSEESPGHWVVYLLPGTFDPEVVPLGGSYRLEVADGKVTNIRPFTNTCIQLRRGPQVAAMTITHLLDPTPTEVHVYWSLWARTPLYVSTDNNLSWKIGNGRISRVVGDTSTASH